MMEHNSYFYIYHSHFSPSKFLFIIDYTNEDLSLSDIRTFISKELFTTTIFAFDNLKHIFRTFFTAVFEPHFYNLRDTGFEKFHMIFNKPILKMRLCKDNIINENFIVIVISKFKISSIQYLIIFYMLK